LPHGVSTSAAFIDGQFALTFVLMGIVFVAAQVALGYVVWKYRERPSSEPVRYSHGNTTLEIVWTALTAILFIGLNLMGSRVWANERFAPAAAGAVPVEVTGMQFAWYFRYPGPDGKFGVTNPRLIDPSAGNESAIGLDTTDPASKDDVVTGTMYVPVGREVDLHERAIDVIHSFFVPSMRFKQDAVPGLEIHIVHENKAMRSLEVRVSVHLIVPRVSQDAVALVEQRFVRLGKLLDAGEELHIGIVEPPQFPPKLRE